MNTKEYGDMHKTCVVNRERKLPLKDVARMLGYFKTCDTPQRSHDHRFIYASGSKKSENMKHCYSGADLGGGCRGCAPPLR